MKKIGYALVFLFLGANALAQQKPLTSAMRYDPLAFSPTEVCTKLEKLEQRVEDLERKVSVLENRPQYTPPSPQPDIQLLNR